MRYFNLLLLSVLVFSCDFNKKKKNVFESHIVTISGQTMGTYYSIKLSEKKVDQAKVKADIDEKLELINQVFSTYIPTSEISKINQMDNKSQMTVSKQMQEVLEISRDIYFKSSGAFNPTVAPVVNRWGFGPIKEQGRPTEEEIKRLMINVGMKHFELRDNVLTKKTPHVQIDLSAIAKGYAVDTIFEYLKKEKGYRNVLVEIGGEVRGYGLKNKTTWAIGIEKPSEKLGSGIQKIVPLLNKSMATSGSYRNFLKYGDEVFSHTIDPETGFPVKHKLISVTVIDPKCVIADAWATALMVMGPEKGLKHANKEGLMAYFLVKTGKGIEEKATEAFTMYLKAFKR